MSAVEAARLEGMIRSICASEVALREAMKEGRVRRNQAWLALSALYSLRHQLTEQWHAARSAEPVEVRGGLTPEQLEGVWQLAQTIVGGSTTASSQK
jgi:hypothetical protein